MGAIHQLGLDHTFFYEFAIFAVLYFVLKAIYFQPFLKLFQARHEKTTKDREAAEKMMQEAQAKLEEYKSRLAQERSNARRDYQAILDEAKKEETTLLSLAREEAKKITQGAAASANDQRGQLRKDLERDVEDLAKNISEKLLSRKV